MLPGGPDPPNFLVTTAGSIATDVDAPCVITIPIPAIGIGLAVNAERKSVPVPSHVPGIVAVHIASGIDDPGKVLWEFSTTHAPEHVTPPLAEFLTFNVPG